MTPKMTMGEMWLLFTGILELFWRLLVGGEDVPEV